MKLLLLIVGLFGVWVVNVESILFNPFDYLKVWLTQPVLYNPLQQKCCNGKAVDSPFGIRFRCCGSAVYDTVTQLCCNKQIQDRTKYQTRSGCCGSNVYDMKAKLCCNNVIKDFPQNVSQKDYVYYTCCGSTPIDNRKSLCCFNMIKPKSNKTTSCCPSTNQIYEPFTQTCFPLDYSTSAGNTTTSNSVETTASTPADVTPMALQCSGKQYNPRKQLCCPSISDYSVSVLHNKTDEDTMCCADKVYNTKSQTCCIDYDSKSVNVLNTTSPDQNLCCGSVPYAAPKFLCCDQKLYNRTDDNGCCGKTVFSYQKQGCCNDKVYDKKKSVCCNYQTLVSIGSNIDPNSAECCGMTAYDKTKEVCCGTKVFAISTGRECCANDIYDPKTEICCGLQKVKITNPSQTVCCLPIPGASQLPQCYLDILLESGQITEDNLTSLNPGYPFGITDGIGPMI